MYTKWKSTAIAKKRNRGKDAMALTTADNGAKQRKKNESRQLRIC
jgi:hypothetical protein